ncbi:hypothetical protein C5B94_03970 [Clavibacter michiganensis]|uniref:hypothetical protein n=1 Tax=Clavibacter michiganensis TaxID=28447 RepID=UPI000CE92349|nr:hypothetical protein [Clavibacter michiganensis]PPF56086.1 hypothetical protein C5B94_03970 [Clavibacter michiganensis]
MATNPATPQNVTDALERPLTPDETRVLDSWLNTAWRKLRARMPALEARMDLPEGSPGRLDEDDVRIVLVAMVERKLRNPEGRRSLGTDDYTETIDGVLSSGQIYVTDEELRDLAPPASGVSGMYSIQLGRP